ncbi:MAG: class I SAM-dependent methyltransferase [Caldilineaceae bacterium]|nr:class I SAM-dependent methyltransferase [Caldilineaceae bacterium]
MVQDFLNETYAALLQGEVGAALTLLSAELSQIRQQTHDVEWTELVRDVFRPHPVTRLIHEDPLIGRGFHYARNHRSNATLFDYIYYYRPVDMDDVSSLGRALFTYTSNTPLARAIRYRRSYIGRMLDAVAAEVDRPSVVVLEPGHLREVEFSFALSQGEIGDFVALGGDEESLERIARTYGPEGVRVRCTSLRGMAYGRHSLADYGVGGEDFIYAPILFNYLHDGQARTVLSQMWQAVRPGGRILICNALADQSHAAFFECFADWLPHYRTWLEIAALAQVIPAEEVAALTLEDDPNHAMGFFMVQKDVA